MRHRKAGVKLNRNSSHRKAMFRNMVTSLLKHERIRTTDTKAKALRGWVDHVITLAKRGDLHARRQALSIVREKSVVHQLFATAPDRFGNRNGGYTRITKIGRRPGDCAPMSLIELVSAEDLGSGQKTAKTETPYIAPTKPATEDAKTGEDTAIPGTAPISDESDVTLAEVGQTEEPSEATQPDRETAPESVDETEAEADIEPQPAGEAPEPMETGVPETVEKSAQDDEEQPKPEKKDDTTEQ